MRLSERVLGLIFDRIDRHFELACCQRIFSVFRSVGAIKLKGVRYALGTTYKQVRHPIHPTVLLFADKIMRSCFQALLCTNPLLLCLLAMRVILEHDFVARHPLQLLFALC